jgi:anaerobic magnesium-protoporphyrin IX monomethyl ester cyclase
MSMNIVLIQPLYRHIYRKIRGVRYLDPPLGLLYIAAALRQDGHTVSVLDAEAEGAENHRALFEKASVRHPDFIGITFTTPMLASAADAVRSVKKVLPNIPVAIGGPHATAEPAATLQVTGADFATIGEGEETAGELVARLSRGEPLDGCRGIVLRSGTSIIENARRPFIKELDALPFPARDLLKIGLYKHASSERRRDNPFYTNIISSRGCPFKCIFCGSAAVFGSILRFRSPSRVVDEMEECMRAHRIGIFGFADDTLTVRKSHVLTICEEILRRGIDPLWMAQARVDTVDEEILGAMKRAGCEEIHFGYESGSQEVLATIKKGITVEQSMMATRLARNAGMKIHGYFMIGNVGETKETARQTITLAKKLNPDTAQFTIAQPFPGTEFYRMTVGEVRGASAFDNYVWYENVNYVPSGLTRDEVMSLHRRAFREFYFRPRFALKVLRKLSSPKDWRWILSGVRSFFNVTREH